MAYLSLLTLAAIRPGADQILKFRLFYKVDS